MEWGRICFHAFIVVAGNPTGTCTGRSISGGGFVVPASHLPHLIESPFVVKGCFFSLLFFQFEI